MFSSIQSFIESRRGEKSALYERYVNPVAVRSSQLFGTDIDYVKGKGAYLWDSAANRYLDCDAGTGFRVKLARLLDFFEYLSCQVLLDQKQDHIALCVERQAEKGFGLDQALAAGVVDDRSARRSGLSGGLEDGVRSIVVDKGNQ